MLASVKIFFDNKIYPGLEELHSFGERHLRRYSAPVYNTVTNFINSIDTFFSRYFQNELTKRHFFLGSGLFFGGVISSTLVWTFFQRDSTKITNDACSSVVGHSLYYSNDVFSISFKNFENVPQAKLIKDSFFALFSIVYALIAFIIFILFYLLGIYSTFFQPFVEMYNAFSLHSLQNQQSTHEANRTYPKLCIVGWNIFRRNPDTNKYDLSLSTEETSHINEIFIEANDLKERLLQIMIEKQDDYDRKDNNTRAAEFAAEWQSDGSQVPSFVIGFPPIPRPDNAPADFDPDKDHKELHRFITNHISNSIKSSQWPSFAHRFKNYANHKHENPLYLINYECNAEVKALRVWLIFPEELKFLRNINLSDGHIKETFLIARDTWKLRLRNLQIWAKYEFDDAGNRRRHVLETDRHTRELYLPLFTSPEIIVTIEWNIFEHPNNNNNNTGRFLAITQKQCHIDDFCCTYGFIKTLILNSIYKGINEDPLREDPNYFTSHRINFTDGTNNDKFYEIVSNFIQESIGLSPSWAKFAHHHKADNGKIEDIYYICSYEKSSLSPDLLPKIEIFLCFKSELEWLRGRTFDNIRANYPESNVSDYNRRLKKLFDWSKPGNLRLSSSLPWPLY